MRFLIPDNFVTRAALRLEEDAVYNVPLSCLRVHDAMATLIPAAAANDDMGYITGTPGTHAPRAQGVDYKTASTDEKASFEFELPPEYQAGESVTLRVNAGMVTTVANGTATLDAEVWKDGGTGTVGSDICATNAQSINSLTAANKDFVITPTSLSPGDKLIVRLSFAGSDSGTGTAVIPSINAIKFLLDVRG